MNQQQELNQDLYSTSDLSLATTISLFFPIENIDRSTNSRKALFIFHKTSELEKLVDQYFRNEIKISPQTYFNQLRAIKARLYEGR